MRLHDYNDMRISKRLEVRSRVTSLEALESKNLFTALGFVPHDLARDDSSLAAFMELMDVDGDGDQDLLVDEGNNLIWYPNLDGRGDFGTKKILAVSLFENVRGRGVHLADLNGDELTDIVLDAHWLENMGDGEFFLKKTVPSKADATNDIVAVDIDGDADLDLIRSGVASLDPVDFLENTDGAGTFVLLETPLFGGIRGLSLADVNGDAFLDVVGSNFWVQGLMGWVDLVASDSVANSFHSLDLGAFAEDKVLWVTPMDWDTDGDVDLIAVAAEQLGAEIRFLWLENDGEGAFTTNFLFEDQSRNSRFLEDFDGDGDRDLVFVDGISIDWIENADQVFDVQAKQQIESSTTGQIRAWPADVDADGDIDILTAVDGDSASITWLENRLVGDANDDGEVNFSDFLSLSANFGAMNAVWESGDFNQDQEVDFSDFLILTNNFGATRGG